MKLKVRDRDRDTRPRDAVRPDKHIETHSLLFTIDVYTETG